MVRVIKRQGIQNPFNAFLNKKPFHHLTHSVTTSTLINSIECFILWVHYNVRNDFLRMASADVWNDTFWSQKTNQFWCKFLTMPQSPAGSSSICITQQLVLVPRRQKFSTLFQLSPSIQQVAKKPKPFEFHNLHISKILALLGHMDSNLRILCSIQCTEGAEKCYFFLEYFVGNHLKATCTKMLGKKSLILLAWLSPASKSWRRMQNLLVLTFFLNSFVTLWNPSQVVILETINLNSLHTLKRETKSRK